MIMKASTTIRAGTMLALASFALASGAVAQDNKLVNGDRPADDAASCNEVKWHQEFVTNYPWASEACRSVTIVNGQKWARFEGEFQGLNDNGSFDAEFTSRSNRDLGRVSLMPNVGQRVRLDNEEVAFADLDRGQILSFYVPEGAVGFAVEPGVPSTQYVKVVDTSNQARFAAADDAPKATPVVMAQADPKPAPVENRLPNTAGPLPFIALGGLMSLLGGLGLTLRRKVSKHNI